MPIRVRQQQQLADRAASDDGVQVLSTPLDKEQFEVATDLYYVNVRKF